MTTTLRAKLPDGRVVGMDSAEYRAFIQAEVAKAPPFSAEQKATLHVLLAPMRVRLRERAEARLAAEREGPAS